MKRMWYILNSGDGLNFGKGWCIPLQPFMPKGKSANHYDRTCRRLGYITPSPSLNQILTSLYHQNLQIRSVGALILVWGWSSKRSLPTWHLSIRRSKTKTSSYSTLIHGNLIFSGKSVSNCTNLQPKIKWSKSMSVIKHTQSSSL